MTYEENKPLRALLHYLEMNIDECKKIGAKMLRAFDLLFDHIITRTSNCSFHPFLVCQLEKLSVIMTDHCGLIIIRNLLANELDCDIRYLLLHQVSFRYLEPNEQLLIVNNMHTILSQLNAKLAQKASGINSDLNALISELTQLTQQ